MNVGTPYTAIEKVASDDCVAMRMYPAIDSRTPRAAASHHRRDTFLRANGPLTSLCQSMYQPTIKSPNMHSNISPGTIKSHDETAERRDCEDRGLYA